MRVGRALALGIIVAALASTTVACKGKPSAAPAASPPPPRSAYDLVLDRVSPDGTVDLDTALAAFSVAIAPLPGVPAQPGRKALVESGTAAVLWTLAHWKELTPAQRDAVRAALNGSGSNKPAAFRVVAAPDDPDLLCQTADSADAGSLRPVLDAAIADVAARLGHPVRIPVFLSINRTQQEDLPDGGPSRMYAVPCRGKAVAETTPPQGCTIHVNPLATSGEYTDHDRKAFLIHEATHCIEMEKFGAGYLALAPWLQEGLPIWVQAALAGGDAMTTRYWTEYLQLDRTSLFGRSYTALGFFAQLANSGVDLWARLEPISAAYLKGGNAAAWKAAGPGADFVRAWAPGHARGARPGPVWDITGYGVPAERPIVAHHDALLWGATVTVSAPAAGVDLIHLALPADSVVTFGGTSGSAGLLGLSDGDHALIDLVGKSFCTKPGGCACPDSSQAPLPAIATGDGYLGVTGGLVPATFTVRISSPEDFCSRKPQCVVGNWVLTTVTLRYSSGDTTITESGGAGMVMRIAADGTTGFDFNPMRPVLFDGSMGLAGELRYHGTAEYKLRIPGPETDQSKGQIGYISGDLSKLTASVRLIKPVAQVFLDHVSVAELAASAGSMGGVGGSPLVGDHQFECSASTLTLLIPPGGAMTGSWTFSRTG